MPELEYTMEIVWPQGVRPPDKDKMAEIVHTSLEREYGEMMGSIIDVEVTRISDDL